ncbi:MAG: hypothetical protein QOF51_2615 [Chloroflexota bacterium]|nr:hypothetical protein [Chloroflexota bacterium]
MQTGTLSIEECLGRGWAAFKDNFGFIVGAAVVSFIILGIPYGLGFAFVDKAGGIAGLFFLITVVIGTVVGLGWMKITLRLVDGQPTSIGDLFNSWNLFLSFFIASIVVGIVVELGYLLLFVPGIFLSVRLAFFGYAIVDQGVGPFEAVQRSWDLTRGRFWSIFLLEIVLFLINAIGAIPVGLGLIVTYPVTAIAIAAAYRQLQGQSLGGAIQTTF